MRWTLIILTGALGFSATSASLSLLPNARLDLHPRKPHFRSGGAKNVATDLSGNRYVETPNSYLRTHDYLISRQAAGRCGAAFSNQRCDGNQCCSSYGYCGTEFEYCGLIVGCQPDFGRCGDSTPAPTTTSTSSPSPTPLPPSSSSIIPPLPSGTLIPSINGQCGNVTTCAGSTFGSCCSEYYYCGSSIDYCGTGCRPGFGTCSGIAPPPSSSSASMPTSSSPTRPPPTSTSTSSSTSSAAPVPTNASTDGRCGSDGNGQTCTGSSFGKCCSSYGWCGDDYDNYCRLSWGCQPQFGTCSS